MSYVKLNACDQVALVRLDHGVTNPIGPGMLDDLDAALERVGQEFRGLVLAGGDKFFSMGLDLPRLIKFSRDEMSSFFEHFSQTLWSLFTLPLPSASAIKGHAVAGGAIFALMTDYRFMAGGKTLMGVNEIKLGLTVPFLPQLVLYDILPAPRARDLIYNGEFAGAEQAGAMGLVDEVCAPADCEARALQKIQEMCGLDQKAFAALKHSRLAHLKERYQEGIARHNREFLELWFTDSCQKLLEQAASKF